MPPYLHNITSPAQPLTPHTDPRVPHCLLHHNPPHITSYPPPTAQTPYTHRPASGMYRAVQRLVPVGLGAILVLPRVAVTRQYKVRPLHRQEATRTLPKLGQDIGVGPCKAVCT